MKPGPVVLAGAFLTLALIAGWVLVQESPGADVPAPSSTQAAPPAGGSALAVEAPNGLSFQREVQPIEGVRLDPTGATDVAKPQSGADVGAAQPAPLRLTVRHAHGAPAAGATVVLVVGEEIVERAELDARGMALLPAREEAVDVWIGGVSDRPLREHLAVPSGEHEIVLPPGSLVTGVVRVNGQPPLRPLPVGIEPPSPVRTAPWIVRDGLKRSVPGLMRSAVFNTQLTGPGGDFVFSVLPDDWAGRFRWPQSVFELDPNGSATIPAPTTGLVLDLRRVPVVSGRVVDSLGDPVPGATVAGRLMFSSGPGNHTTVGLSVAADGDGRFALPLPSGKVRELWFRISHPEGLGYRELDVSNVDHEHDTDLGDIELHSAREVPLIVSDVRGEAIAGAIALVEGIATTRSAPTDDMGMTVVPGVPLDVPAVSVHALHHASTQVPLPPVIDGPLPVVLADCASLEVRVSTVSGEAPRDLQLRLRAEEAIMVSKDGFSPGTLRRDLGVSMPSRTTWQTRRLDDGVHVLGSTTFPVESSEPLLLSCMLPWVPFTARITDRYGHVFWSDVITLSEGESRRVEVAVSGTARDVDVLVVDEAGVPVEDARVRVVVEEKMKSPGQPEMTIDLSQWETTNGSGVVRFESMYGSYLGLLVSKRGYATERMIGAALPPPGAALLVVLKEGRTVTVQVVSHTGKPEEARVRAELDGRRVGRVGKGSSRIAVRDGVTVTQYSTIETSEGLVDAFLVVLQDLPTDVVTLVATHDGLEARLEHDARKPDAKISMPPFGILEITWSFPLSDDVRANVEIRPENAALEQRSSYVSVGDRERLDGRIRPWVAPAGTYEIQLSGSFGSGHDTVFKRLSGRHLANVALGEVTTVLLQP